MPTYKVTQKQGNRIMTSTIEAKSLASLKAFLDQISTAKTTCIYEVHYENDTDTPPIDDFNYFKQFKAMARNKNKISRQILLHNLKPNLTQDRIYSLINTHLEVTNLPIDGITCVLFMK